MRLFLPDWDDRIDPDFDFLTERFRLGRDPRKDDRYAYEVLDRPCDGVLVSRSALPSRGPKADDIANIGLREALRLPTALELMGDCGAFSYAAEAEPPYTTAEIGAFYQDNSFDYGVSVDHIARFVGGDARDRRYRLTIDRALELLAYARATDASFLPVGAVQGWDAGSYAAAASQLVAAGYQMLAVGGLVRSDSSEVLEIIRAIVAAVGPGIRLHVLGVARLDVLADLIDIGVTSVDTASPVRAAWTSARRNYLLGESWFTAIRVPFAAPRPGLRGERALQVTNRPETADLVAEEQAVLGVLRRYANETAGLDDVLGPLASYDARFERRTATPNEASGRLAAYRRTLAARPWTKCPCAICREIGVEVVIFRGSNRNRRRGFHNLYQLAAALAGHNAARRASAVELATS
jgi:hypothetical protein